MTDLYERVMRPYLHEQEKHGLGEGYAERTVNSMSNTEFLRALSEALSEMLEARAVAEKTDDGWIPWSGGKQPVDGDTVVFFRYRDGEESMLAARYCDWTHEGNDSDIIAYKLVPTD